jgi:hypothetical protein
MTVIRMCILRMIVLRKSTDLQIGQAWRITGWSGFKRLFIIALTCLIEATPR